MSVHKKMDGQVNLRNVFNTVNLPISHANDVIESVKNSFSTIETNLLRGSVKLQIVAKIEFEKPGTQETITTYVSTRQHSFTRSQNLANLFNDSMVYDLLSAIDTAKMRGSGWSEASVLSLELKQSRYHPILGKSSLPLPDELANKKAIVNIKNNDDQCLLWYVLAKLYHAKSHAERT